ncbi:hypothetical protein [Methanobacterium sp.]|uniref:hypothetical protein n=1 Tax=Methanobacterium sp. TaxID=2164 RepID=UPI0031594FCF
MCLSFEIYSVAAFYFLHVAAGNLVIDMRMNTGGITVFISRRNGRRANRLSRYL